MTVRHLVDSKGHQLRLDHELASGGEGAVYALPNDNGRVAKVYHRPPSALLIEKLNAMQSLCNPALLKIAAWPSELIFDVRSRCPAGFLMPRLKDCESIQSLYNPIQRLKHFPKAGWKFQLRAAMNLAAAFDEVHNAGCIIGDVNQSNAQVSSQALVRLIDCDSFQLQAKGRQFLCEVGVAQYTPPELQSKSLRGFVRSENHDRFGLAVLVYQLLFVGRHPYAGVYNGKGDPSFEELIAEYRFAQGPMASSWGMSPPPHTPTFADIPPVVAQLFRRAFEKGSEQGSRPRASEWVAALRQLEHDTVNCSVDSGHSFWRGARSCVWCRLAQRGGPEYYYNVAGNSESFAVDEARLAEVLRRLNSCRIVEVSYDRASISPQKLPAPTPPPEGLSEHRAYSALLGSIAGIGGCMIAGGVMYPSIALVGLLIAMIFGIWFSVVVSQSPWQQEKRQRIKNRGRIRGELERQESSLGEIARQYRVKHDSLANLVRNKVNSCRELGPQLQKERQKLIANAESASRERHLRLYLIADAEIEKIGNGRKQVLASNGIYTAADIDEYRIRQISGFKDALTSNLILWKQEVLQRFRFDPKSAVSNREMSALTVKMRAQQNQVMLEIEAHLNALHALGPQFQSNVRDCLTIMQSVVTEYAQAISDENAMTRRNSSP